MALIETFCLPKVPTLSFILGVEQCLKQSESCTILNMWPGQSLDVSMPLNRMTILYYMSCSTLCASHTTQIGEVSLVSIAQQHNDNSDGLPNGRQGYQTLTTVMATAAV